jgi:hypothetical protein
MARFYSTHTYGKRRPWIASVVGIGLTAWGGVVLVAWAGLVVEWGWLVFAHGGSASWSGPGTNTTGGGIALGLLSGVGSQALHLTSLLTAAPLIVAGIGLLYLRDWARVLAIVLLILGVPALLWSLVPAAVMLLGGGVLLPQAWDAGASTLAFPLGMVAVAIGGLALDIVLIVLLTRPHLREAFRAAEAAYRQRRGR